MVFVEKSSNSVDSTFWGDIDFFNKEAKSIKSSNAGRNGSICIAVPIECQPIVG